MDAQLERLLCHRVLGTEAIYRPIASDQGCVEVEVVRAPGLAAGTRLRLTRASVDQMSVVADVRGAGETVGARSSAVGSPEPRSGALA